MANLQSIHDSGVAVHALQMVHDSFPGGVDLGPEFQPDLTEVSVPDAHLANITRLGSLSDDGVVFDALTYDSITNIDDAPVAIVPCESVISEKNDLKGTESKGISGSASYQLL